MNISVTVLAALLLWGLPSQSANTKRSVSKACAGAHSSATKASYKNISSLIDSRFKGIDTTWVEGRRPSDPRIEKIRDNILTLTDADKAQLLKDLHRAYSKAKTKPPIFIRLALNDVDAWIEFIETGYASAMSTFELPMFGEYKKLVDHLPQSAKERLLQWIGEKYPSAKKPTRRTNDLYSKRILDAWLRALLRGDQIITERIKQGRSALEAYDEYLKAIRTKVLTEKSITEEGYGLLTAKDILDIARVIQGVLREAGENYFNSGVSDGTSIIFFGSTVKGLAKSGSDIDLAKLVGDSVTTESLLHGFWAISKKGESYHAPGIIESVREFMRKGFPGFELQADHFSATSDVVQLGLVLLEPVVIEIKSDEISMLVYSVGTKASFNGFSNWTFDEPQKFVLWTSNAP